MIQCHSRQVGSENNLRFLLLCDFFYYEHCLETIRTVCFTKNNSVIYEQIVIFP